MSALASSSLMAVDSCSYGCLGKPESISVTRRRAMTAGTRPGIAMHAVLPDRVFCREPTMNRWTERLANRTRQLARKEHDSVSMLRITLLSVG